MAPDSSLSDKNLLDEYLKRILNARVYEVAHETPLELAPNLSGRFQNRIFLKREDLQPVFSFKLRGAYNKMVRLPAETLRAGVIASSAGNHAQGVALAASQLGCRAVIVMPATAPRIKVKAVQARGAEVVLHGDTYEDAFHHARMLADRDGLAFIHPYDDPDVIAGQGTIAVEILRQYQGSLDAIFVAVGGGGMISGVAAYIKALRPEIRIVGVEPVDADSMTRALAEGYRVKLPTVGLFADGVAVKQVGEEPFRICRIAVDEMVTVTTDETCAAIKDVFEDSRSILEPAGALPVAGLKKVLERDQMRDGTFVAITCGANMNFDRLRFVAERAELGEHREALFAATVPEKPGSFRRFCSLIGARQVTEFNYRYADREQARVFVGAEVRNRDEYQELLARLDAEFPGVVDLSDNEMAKLHVRHMVGGRSPGVANERIYRFEFPERPGALMRFLERMSSGWNISLFHYRNHGADVGRVLAGIQVPAGDDEAFDAFLRGLDFPFWEETQNPAYSLFLG